MVWQSVISIINNIEHDLNINLLQFLFIERDWGDRPNPDKSQSWNPNRRTWVGGDTQSDDNLPEWYVPSNNVF